MSNAEGFARLDDFVRRLRTAGQALPDMAAEVADRLRLEALAAVSEQRSMAGKPWPATLAGTPALRNAAAALSTQVLGTVAVVRLAGHHVYHHFGAGKSGARGRRELLPTGGMPQKLGQAIRAGIVDMGVAWMTRGGGHGKRFGKGAKPRA